MIDESHPDFEIMYENPLNMPDSAAAARAEILLRKMIADKDSIGGTIDCIIQGLPVGLGDPVFEKLDANLAKAIMSIGSVKGVEIGDGFRAAEAYGSENRRFCSDTYGITKENQHAGGILGGMSDGFSDSPSGGHKP